MARMSDESFKSGRDIFEEMIYGTDAVLKRKRQETLDYERELAAIRAQSQPTSIAPDEPKPSAIFTHSPTYQKLLFRGQEYDLTRHRYASKIVKVLHESLEAGELGLTTVQIRTRAEIPHNGKMYDWFRGTNLWKKLIIASGCDLYRLDI